MKNGLFCLILALLVPILTLAQKDSILSDSILSTYLKEHRQMQIIPPKDYNEDSKNAYDVLYVLYGEWSTSLSQTVLEFLGFAECSL